MRMAAQCIDKNIETPFLDVLFGKEERFNKGRAGQAGLGNFGISVLFSKEQQESRPEQIDKHQCGNSLF